MGFGSFIWMRFPGCVDTQELQSGLSDDVLVFGSPVSDVEWLKLLVATLFQKRVVIKITKKKVSSSKVRVCPRILKLRIFGPSRLET